MSRRGETVTAADGSMVQTREVEIPVQQYQKEYVSTVVERGPIVTRRLPRTEEVVEEVDVEVPLARESRESYTFAIMVLMLFCILISIIVIILLWVVDFQTNQFADTAMLAILIVFEVVVVVLAYYLQPVEEVVVKEEVEVIRR